MSAMRASVRLVPVVVLVEPSVVEALNEIAAQAANEVPVSDSLTASMERNGWTWAMLMGGRVLAQGLDQ